MTTEQLEALKAVQYAYQKMQVTEEVLDESILRYGEKNVGKRDPDQFSAEKLAGEDKDPKVAYSNKPKVHPSTLRAVQASQDAESGRYYHKVPFAYKDAFKAIGGKWDNDRKSWYLTNKETSDANKAKFFKEDLDEAEYNGYGKEIKIPKLIGMHFYNVPEGKEKDAASVGVKQTKSGKWALPKYDTSGASHDTMRRRADIRLGKGVYWEPKTTNEELDEALTGREALAVAAKKKGFGTPEKEALLLKQKAEMEARHAKADADYEVRYGKKPSVNEDSDLEEKVSTPADIEQRADVVKSMKKKLPELKAKYGDRAPSVMYAIATNVAKKQPD